MVVTKWFRAKFIGEGDDADSSSNALLSDLARNSEQILWLRVNDLVGGNKHLAEAHAENLAEQTIKLACEKTQSAQLARYLAEAEVERVRDQSGATIRQLTEQLDQAACQLAAAGQRAAAAEQRATAAMQRANEAEAALRRLQAQILAKGIMKKMAPRAA
jgi:hypothetical protein